MKPAPSEPDSKPVALSGRLYQRLLAAYPKAHRREYGPPMAQLFRDQCRDAWRRGRGWGLTWLWLRVLPDLVKTSVLEHLSTLKERKTMLERIGTLLRPRSAPLFVFIAVAVPVFLLVVVTSTLVTFILPESYASTARVIVRQAPSEASQKADARAPLGPYDPYFLQTQFELIQSQVVLDKVINDLDLNQGLGQKVRRRRLAPAFRNARAPPGATRTPSGARHQPDRNPRLQRPARRSGSIGERHCRQLSRIPVAQRPRGDRGQGRSRPETRAAQ